jgi:hypothetical protein
MNWLIIISNIAFGLISASLCAVGWNTQKAIKHINVGKMFWIPLFLSSFPFAISSLITILNDAFLSLTVAFEIEQIAQLTALCFLMVGVYGYSRMIKLNMPEKITTSEENPAQKGKKSPYSPLTTFVYHKKDDSNDFQRSSSSECNHQLGYLATVPADASFPEECLSCDKIMECKQS